MKVIHCECDRFERLLRGLGRATSVLGAVQVAVLVPTLRPAEAGCLVAVAVASLVAWRRERQGAVVALAAFGLFLALSRMRPGRPPVPVLPALPAVMFLLAWGRERLRFHLMNRTTTEAA
jgi:hypothetical protein